MNKTLRVTPQHNAFTRAVVALVTLCLGLCLGAGTLGGCSPAGSDYFPADTSTSDGVLSSSEAAQKYNLDERDLALRSTTEGGINTDFGLWRSNTADGATTPGTANAPDATFDASDIPPFAGVDVIELNNNLPQFTDTEKEYAPFEFYGNLDNLGRCTVAFALAGPETMPTEKRGDIHKIYPSGWEQAFYDFVDQEALYNRTHLIGYMLTAENANERNLITGTRHLNAEVMLPYEEAVTNYIDETGNHVLYRVTPYFVDNELVARGLQMEAYSIEDNGKGVCFNIFCYNTEPGIEIDYETGESWLADNENYDTSSTTNPNTTSSTDIFAWGKSDANAADDNIPDDSQSSYVLNVKSHKFHKSDCPSVKDITAENRQPYGTCDF